MKTHFVSVDVWTCANSFEDCSLVFLILFAKCCRLMDQLLTGNQRIFAGLHVHPSTRKTRNTLVPRQTTHRTKQLQSFKMRWYVRPILAHTKSLSLPRALYNLSHRLSVHISEHQPRRASVVRSVYGIFNQYLPQSKYRAAPVGYF